MGIHPHHVDIEMGLSGSSPLLGMAYFRDVGLFLRLSLFQICRSSFELQSISKALIYTCVARFIY